LASRFLLPATCFSLPPLASCSLSRCAFQLHLIVDRTVGNCVLLFIHFLHGPENPGTRIGKAVDRQFTFLASFHNFSIPKFLHILVPLYGKEILLSAVTLTARRHAIAPSRFSPAYERDYMVHCQLGRGHLLVAIVAFPPGDLALPPLRPAQLPGFLFFRLKLFR
jgi:hypothetical protein